jgi:hypothetical protein
MTLEQNPDKTKIKFPYWQYLNQPLFGRETRLILNPRRFAYMYRIGLLERCLTRQYDAKGPYHS